MIAGNASVSKIATTAGSPVAGRSAPAEDLEPLREPPLGTPREGAVALLPGQSGLPLASHT